MNAYMVEEASVLDLSLVAIMFRVADYVYMLVEYQ